MPRVGKKHFPYTRAGREAAARERAKQKGRKPASMKKRRRR